MAHNPHPEERNPATVQTAIAATGTKKRTAFPKLLSTSASSKKFSARQVATTKDVLWRIPRRQRTPEGVEIEMLSSSKARNPLDLNGSDFIAWMKDIVPVLAEFLDHLPNAPFIQEADSLELLRDPFMRPAPSESGPPVRESL